MPLPSLGETQHYLWRLITAPEGVAAGLAAVDDIDPPLAALLGEIVAGDERLSAVQRLDVYANMYFYRLLDSIKEDYPSLLAVVGDESFHNLITDYLLQHPSRHWSLRYAGMYLPGFLRHHALAEARPWLAPLAELEWAILDAFDAADSPVLSADDLEDVAPEAWETIRFAATPSVRLLRLDWKIDIAWEQAQRGDNAEPLREPSALLVWRQSLRVYHRPVEGLELECLARLLAGEPFAAWCEHVAESTGDEAAAEQVVAVLRRWLRDGVLSRFALG